MKELNLNPKNRRTGDCVVRAIANATEQRWDDVYNGLCEIGFKTKRMPNSKQTYEKYLTQLGWVKHPQPRTDFGGKFTIMEFLKQFCKRYDKVIISCANHLTSADYGELVDIWDCSGKCVGNYWTKM